jgi:glycosyltransferase involved in cell wall biosynthesis
MKICLINNLFKPFNVGGAENVVETIAKLLVNAGHDVRVLTIGVAGLKEISLDGYKLVQLENKFIYHRINSQQQNILKKMLWHWQNVFSFMHAQQVEDYFLDWQPDLVWTHNLSGFGWQVVKVINKFALRHWHELHDFQLINPLGTFLYKQKKQLNKLPIHLAVYSWLAKNIFNKIDLVISPSEFLLTSHQNFNFFKDCKTEVLPNPVSCLDQEKREVTKINGFVKLLYVGQLEEHKGVRLLLKIFSLINNSNLRLVMVGEGALLEECKRFAQYDGRVEVAGKVDSSLIPRYYRAADVVVYPSECFENMPTVIAEANLCGRMVLASDIGGIGEMIVDGVNGWLIETGNINAWVNAIKKILKNPEDMINNESRVSSIRLKYSYDEYASKIKELLK